MIIGITKEIKDGEGRVALLPEAVRSLVRQGITVLVEKGAGCSAGFPDMLYKKAGGQLINQASRVWQRADLIVKVKEPLLQEFKYFRPGLKLFCFLHLAANPRLVVALKKHRVKIYPFEEYRNAQGLTAILHPMSEIAGKLSIALGLHFLGRVQGGKGVWPNHVVVVGAGSVGLAATQVALGVGARVSLFDVNKKKGLSHLKRNPQLKFYLSRPQTLSTQMKHADIVIGAVHVPKSKTPHVIRAAMVKKMEPGSVLVDVAVDQGGASETTHPTSHSHPSYVKYDVIHVAIPNIPALVPRTASIALSKVVAPLVPKVLKNSN
ncbi:MAG: alanine dehydrogenase [Deltaproteobacteria bacterium]|nr:alanine dehydrogenase [Deltaproteobacteria bacterium]